MRNVSTFKHITHDWVLQGMADAHMGARWQVKALLLV
jgi:hypothetical protein